ncbi:MAG: 2-dehydropantoate 2-reductase [Candidatus Melainabacteria bacterium]|jgi:2-dehydropantoate 2-reductase|nr:2-dehydropantoate 2-reductase [Candidatus Melainabacteria bacterium]
MRTLILGAGATGGYFGGRLLETGADVTFLLRPKRARHLKEHGLSIKSKFADSHLEDLKIIEKADEPYDLIILSCKAYDLHSAMESISGAVGASTTILPLLNGMRHFDDLKKRFGEEKVIGGFCVIAATMDADGNIQHLNDAHTIKYGEMNGSPSKRISAIDKMFEPANCVSKASETIVADMWEKWVMISSLAALTTMMRANVGEVARSPGGPSIAARLFEECVSIARAHGCNPSDSFIKSMSGRLSDPASTLAASMCRDVERGNNVEADQILGNLLEKAQEKRVETPILEIAYCNVKAYEQRRAAAAAAAP